MENSDLEIGLTDLQGTLLVGRSSKLNKELADTYGKIKAQRNIKFYLITSHTSSDYRMDMLGDLENEVIKPAKLESDILFSDGIFHLNGRELTRVDTGNSVLNKTISRGIPPIYRLLAEYFGVDKAHMTLIDDDYRNRMDAEASHCRAVPPIVEEVLAAFLNNGTSASQMAGAKGPALV